MSKKEDCEQRAGADCSNQLAEDVWQNELNRQTSGDPEPQCHRGIEMRAGDVTESINHREDHEPKGKTHANIGHCTFGYVIDNDRARPGKDEGEGAESFGETFLHVRVHTITWPARQTRGRD